MASKATDLCRELAYRAADGLEVVLFRHQDTGELNVAVSDIHSGAYFELAVAPDQGLDVRNHPYAHAAFRGLPYVEQSLASWAKAAATVPPTDRPHSRPGRR
jgi:hypothetical protein